MQYFKDNNFKELYATQNKTEDNYEIINRYIMEKPSKEIFSYNEIKAEISCLWQSYESKFKKNNKGNFKCSNIFYSDTKFNTPICYSNLKFSKNGITCLYYNTYPQENYVEVRKYKDKDLIYVKQYKKFKFLAKIRYYLGI